MNRKTDTAELRKVMAENGIVTILDLAEKTGLHRGTLGKVLRGEIQPSADVMYKLTETLNIDPERAGRIFFADNLLIA